MSCGFPDRNTKAQGPEVASHPAVGQQWRSPHPHFPAEIGLSIRVYLWFAVPKPIPREALYRNHLVCLTDSCTLMVPVFQGGTEAGRGEKVTSRDSNGGQWN